MDVMRPAGGNDAVCAYVVLALIVLLSKCSLQLSKLPLSIVQIHRQCV